MLPRLPLNAYRSSNLIPKLVQLIFFTLKKNPFVSNPSLAVDLSNVCSHVDANAPTYIKRLAEVVAIDSVSSDAMRRGRVSFKLKSHIMTDLSFTPGAGHGCLAYQSNGTIGCRG